MSTSFAGECIFIIIFFFCECELRLAFVERSFSLLKIILSSPKPLQLSQRPFFPFELFTFKIPSYSFYFIHSSIINTQNDANCITNSNLFCSFHQYFASMDTMIAMGKRLVLDVEQMQATNKLVEVSREIEEAMKLLERREIDVKEREDKINREESEFKDRIDRVESDFRSREELLAKHKKEVDEREAKLAKKEKSMEEDEKEKRWQFKEKELQVKETELKERELRVQPREERIKENITNTPSVVKVHIGMCFFFPFCLFLI